MTRPFLIGITQNVVQAKGYNERRDVLDQRWTKFLFECGFEHFSISNCHPNPVELVENIGIKGIILSGGNNLSSSIITVNGNNVYSLPESDNLAPERDETESSLLRASLKHGWPVLGICRGMQVINVFHGGSIQPIEGHVGIYHKLEILNKEEQKWIQTTCDKVNSFHNFGILKNDVAPEMKILAIAGDSVEAIIHNQYKHLGIMWHPEREETYNYAQIELIKLFFKES